jgi:hypothetical protein
VRRLVTTPGAGAPPFLNLEGSLGWGRTGFTPETAGLGHDVYENRRTYRKIDEFAENCMSLKQKNLSHWDGSQVWKKGN